MSELKNYTSQNIIDSLPFFEFAAREKRLPKFHKWKMLKIVGFELYDKHLMRMVPDEAEMGFNAEQLNKIISIEEMIEKVPKEIQSKGGWVVFEDRWPKKFITHQEHVDNYRKITDEFELAVLPVRKYMITKISKREDGWIIRCGETQWFFINPIFNVLRPRVKDWLTITCDKQFGIIRNPEAVDYVPMRFRDKKDRVTEDLDEDEVAHQNPTIKQEKPAYVKPTPKEPDEKFNKFSEDERAQHEAFLAAQEHEEVVVEKMVLAPVVEEELELPPAEIKVECIEGCQCETKPKMLSSEERERVIDFLKKDLEQPAA